jgi:hypothetical protein
MLENLAYGHLNESNLQISTRIEQPSNCEDPSPEPEDDYEM